VRIVFDTNFVFSALIWKGPPFQLLEIARQRESIKLFTSPRLLAELSVILNRPRNAKYLAIAEQTAEQLLEAYQIITTLVEPTSVPRIIAHDPADDHVIAAAVAAQADLIVSGDKRHLQSLGSHNGIAIISPRAALDRIGQ
jgi:uncharacterized protein